MKREIGHRIRIIRSQLNLSQADFAAPLGVDRGHISGIETGSRYPSEPLMKLICFVYGVNEAWLKTGEGEMFVPPEEALEKLMARYGEQAYKNAYHMVFNSSSSSQLIRETKESYQLDPDLEKMIDLLKFIWASGDEELKAWAKVQFRRAFPEDIKKDLQMSSGNKNKDHLNYFHLSLSRFK